MRLTVLRAGDVAAPVAARRGQFFGWIRREVAPVWDGEWIEHDLRDEASSRPDPESAAGFIITGSSSSVTERASWMLRAEALIRRLVERRVPLFGICFGHQMIAEALGGKVAKNPRGREIGTVSVRIRRQMQECADPILTGLPLPFAANATHVDTVSVLPPGATVLAETDLDAHAIYVVGETTKCVQFHPEFDGDAMRGYIDARSALITAEGLDLAAIRTRASDTPDGATTLRNFVTGVVKR
jgi:GMP synthase (glutamine-hydrolysing)